MHILNRNSDQFSFSSSYNEITVGQNSDDGYSQAEKSLDGTNSLVDSFLDIDFENISSLGATVNIRILVIDGCTGKLTLDVTEISIQRLNFLVDLVNGQNLDAILLNSDQTVGVIVEEDNFVDNFLVWSSIEALAGLNIPDYQHIPTWKQKYLSSRHPWVANSLESGENERLVTDCL